MSDRDAEYSLEDPDETYADDEGADERAAEGGRRKKRGRSIPGCLAALVALALIAGGAYVAVTKGAEFIRDQFSTSPDFAGPGKGKVTFQVKDGDTVGAIGRNLKDKGVVESVDAFMTAAGSSTGIQVGYYQLKKEMKAADAFTILSNPANIIKTTVTIPEGFQVDQVVQRLAASTDYPAKAFEKVLADPAKIGLPDYANGNAEGYLFPSTYDFGPKDKPFDMLTKMVARWQQAADDAGLEEKAADLGYTPGEIMTVASLIEAEGRGNYRPKIARVIYNRLEIDPNPAAGLLQIDATVNFALGKPGPAVLTQDEIDSVADSPYNTYTHKGLPPGPIEAPGDDAIAAALHPDDGPWFFYVTVNLATGETRFTDDYNEFLTFKGELQDYCATQSDRC
ncbi:MAG: endolytic transglycosylase MltG [Nocardioides sp.]